MGTGEDATIEFAIPYETPSGRRIFVTGSPTQAVRGLPRRLTRRAADRLRGRRDGDGRQQRRRPRRRQPLDLRPARSSTTPSCSRRLRARNTATTATTATSPRAPITNSPFKIVLDASKSDLYESISGTAISWIIFAAFALALFGGLFLLRRALDRRRRAAAARAERAPRGRDQRQHHPGARARQVQAPGRRGRGERRPGVGDAARGPAARVGPARRRRGAGRPAAARDRRRDDAARGAPRRRGRSSEPADLGRRLRRRARAAPARPRGPRGGTARWRSSARPATGARRSR